METKLQGTVWVFGDSISTDHIIAGKYLGSMDPAVYAPHAMEAVDPEWASKVKPGDLIVAGTNFGSGSSREQAPLALQHLGIVAVVATSFARIFFRNMINLGIPVVVVKDLDKAVKSGETLQIDLVAGSVTTASGQTFETTPFPPHIMTILEAGGLVPKLKAELANAPTNP